MSTSWFKTEVKINISPLLNLYSALDNISETMQLAGDNMVNAIEPPLIDELGFEPGRVKYPIQWKSERQRRAFFATNGFGRGIPTQRTGRMVNGWVIDRKPEQRQYTMRLRNTANYTQFVVGRVNFLNRNNAVSPMQPFHVITGWYPATTTIKYWFDAGIEEYQKQIRDILNEAVRRGNS